MKADPDTLMLISGGLDSTYCLWQRVQAGLRTRIHHVHLSDWEGRRDAEARAVSSVLNYMDAHGGRELIVYSESVVDFGTLSYVPYNFHQWGYWIGAILAQSAVKGRYYDAVILPLNADDHPDGIRWATIAARNAMRSMVGREFRIEKPIIHLSKRDIVAAMPPGLVDLCWWCRRPKNGQQCHVCDSCSLMDAALKDPGPCARLPEASGWSCSRPGGHDGHCSPSRRDGTTP